MVTLKRFGKRWSDRMNESKPIKSESILGLRENLYAFTDTIGYISMGYQCRSSEKNYHLENFLPLTFHRSYALNNS